MGREERAKLEREYQQLESKKVNYGFGMYLTGGLTLYMLIDLFGLGDPSRDTPFVELFGTIGMIAAPVGFIVCWNMMLKECGKPSNGNWPGAVRFILSTIGSSPSKKFIDT